MKRKRGASKSSFTIDCHVLFHIMFCFVSHRVLSFRVYVAIPDVVFLCFHHLGERNIKHDEGEFWGWTSHPRNWLVVNNYL